MQTLHLRFSPLALVLLPPVFVFYVFILHIGFDLIKTEGLHQSGERDAEKSGSVTGLNASKMDTLQMRKGRYHRGDI